MLVLYQGKCYAELFFHACQKCVIADPNLFEFDKKVVKVEITVTVWSLKHNKKESKLVVKKTITNRC